MRCRLVNHVIAIPCIHFLLLFPSPSHISISKELLDDWALQRWMFVGEFCVCMREAYSTCSCSANFSLHMNLHVLILSFLLNFFLIFAFRMMESPLKIHLWFIFMYREMYICNVEVKNYILSAIDYLVTFEMLKTSTILKYSIISWIFWKFQRIFKWHTQI